MTFEQPQKDFHILLASRSPRRSWLLEREGFAYSVIAADVEEHQPCSQTVRDIVVENARLKGQAVINHLLPEEIPATLPCVLIAADTLVVLGNKVFGKPNDLKEAKAMLTELALQPHLVLTGIYMKWLHKGYEYCGVTTTQVTLISMNDQELESLFKKSTPLDKAAGYGFQDAPEIVKHLEGSATNVIGLPMETVLHVLSGWARLI